MTNDDNRMADKHTHTPPSWGACECSRVSAARPRWCEVMVLYSPVSSGNPLYHRQRPTRLAASLLPTSFYSERHRTSETVGHVLLLFFFSFSFTLDMSRVTCSCFFLFLFFFPHEMKTGITEKSSCKSVVMMKRTVPVLRGAVGPCQR